MPWRPSFLFLSLQKGLADPEGQAEVTAGLRRPVTRSRLVLEARRGGGGSSAQGSLPKDCGRWRDGGAGERRVSPRDGLVLEMATYRIPAAEGGRDRCG